MNFKLFLMWTFVLIGRPQDLIVSLQSVRPALLLAALSAGSTFFGPGGRRLSSLFKMTEARKYILFYLIMVLGIPFAYHKGVALNSILLGYLVNILFFLTFVIEVDSLKKLKIVLFVISLCTFFYGFFGIMNGSSYGGRFEIYGGMFDANDIAYVLISLFPLSFYFIIQREGTIKKIIAIISVVTALLVTLYTGSRGGILGLIAVIAFFLFTKSAYIRRSHKILIIIFMLAISILNRDKIDIDRYMSIADVSNDYNVTDEFGRIQIWKRAIDLLISNPLLGVGVDCSPIAIGYAREAQGAIPRWQAIHNSYLQVASETGVIAFIIFLTLITRSFKTFWQTKKLAGASKELGEIRTIAWLIYIAFIGQLVTAIFLSQGYSMIFTLFFSLSAALRQIAASVKNDEHMQQSLRSIPSTALSDNKTYMTDPVFSSRV